MKLFRLLGLTPLGLAALTSPAHACNIDDDVEIIQGELGDFREVRAVVLARVSRVAPVARDHFLYGFPGKDRDQIWKTYSKANWDAVLDYVKTLRGSVDNRLFVVSQRGWPGHCDNRGPPAIGELRVVYIRKDNRAYDVDPKFVRLNDPEVRLKPPYGMPH